MGTASINGINFPSGPSHWFYNQFHIWFKFFRAWYLRYFMEM